MASNQNDNKDMVPNNKESEPRMLPPDWEKDSEFVPKAGCKLCDSPYREEAEHLYDRTNNFRRVYNFLKEDRQVDISYPAVIRHLKNHYQAVIDKNYVKEFAQDLKSWVNMQVDPIAGMKRGMAILEREMMVLASKTDDLNLDERRKTAEVIAKLGDLLLKYRSELKRSEKDHEPVTLVLNQLKVVLQEELQNSDSPESRHVVQNVMSKLTDSCGDIELNG